MSAAFDIRWVLPQRVIYARLHHQLQGEESAEIDRALVQMIRAGEAPVYLIMDLREIQMMQQPNVGNLAHVTYRSEANLQWILIVTNDHLMRFLTSTVTQMAGKLFGLYESMDALIVFLSRQFPDTDWSLQLKSCA